MLPVPRATPASTLAPGTRLIHTQQSSGETRASVSRSETPRITQSYDSGKGEYGKQTSPHSNGVASKAVDRRPEGVLLSARG